MLEAVILAAGVGRRLGDHGDRPKCLLEFDGATLLERHLAILKDCGVDQVTMCVGYKQEQIAAHLAAIGRQDVELVFNDRYTEGSVISLWTARACLSRQHDIVLMDADVLYTPEIMRRLVSTPLATRMLCDRDFVPGDEPVKICLNNDRVVDFRKRIDKDLEYNDCGESVGFFLFTADMALRLQQLAGEYVDENRGQEPYEEVIRDLALDDPAQFAVVDVTGLPWLEIDFPEDIERARIEVLPRINDNKN